MAEYTYKDVIIDPTSEEAKNCIGKYVYFSNSPDTCLVYAKKDRKDRLGILTKIYEVCGPFNIKHHIEGFRMPCIILKKEEPEPKYIPFESADEFLDAYEDSNYSITNGTIENRLLNYGGIWLEQEYGDCCDYYNVTGICDKLGLTIGSDTAMTRWNALLKNYKFLDGTPCGKLKGEEL